MLASQEDIEKWAERYAHRIQRRFEQWQRPLGIDGEYAAYLAKELATHYNDPVQKSLIESIS